jgi:pentatricopeptide repeat protein
VFLQNLGVPPDLTSYNILLKTCCSVREFNLAQEIYEEMKKKERDGLLKLDVFTYSTMMKVWGLLLLSMHYGFLWFPEFFSL